MNVKKLRGVSNRKELMSACLVLKRGDDKQITTSMVLKFVQHDRPTWHLMEMVFTSQALVMIKRMTKNCLEFILWNR